MLFSIGILPVNTYADPGFSGHLGIVMHNLLNSYIKINPGDPIAKIEFSCLNDAVSKPYEGQHGYQTEIWPLRTDMILDSHEEQEDHRIGKPYEEIERAYGKELGKVIKRVFAYERRLLLFASIYFLIMLLIIAIAAITAETVEKASIHDFAIYKYLKSLYAKLLESDFLDFFDSLAINDRFLRS